MSKNGSMVSYTTSLWQEQRRKSYYRIQTDDPVVARKLRRRTTFELVCNGVNKSIWIFRGTYSTPYKAKISLQRLTGQKIRKDTVTDGFMAVTYPILTSKSIS